MGGLRAGRTEGGDHHQSRGVSPGAQTRLQVGRRLWPQRSGERRSSAQITDLYAMEALSGKQVLGVVNFPPKQIGPVRSECLVTGFVRDDGAVVLAVPDQTVPNGLKLA